MTDAERPARERIQRTLILALGVGAIVFGALLATGPSGFLAQIDQLRSPFGIVTIVVGVVIPALFTVLARLLPMRILLGLVGGTAITFLAIELLWPFVMIDPVLADDATPWIQGINAVHATAAAIAWPRIIGWVYPLIQGPIVALTQVQVRNDATLAAVLDGLGAIIFGLIVCGVAIAMIAAGDRQDAAAAHARNQAALEASRRTREAEQARINAIVHDDVLTVLLSASRESPPAALADQATRALGRVAALAGEDPESRTYGPDEFAAVIRSTAAEIDPIAPVRFSVDGDSPVPAPVVAAFAEATAEAMRNAVRHAGAEGLGVELDVDDAAARVVIADRGPGFVARQVSQRRLGIRVSILERMRAVPGGEATLVSTPGRGTAVTLTWSRA
ncbi:ATP-binding protein [Demequina sp.]|uniref:sensor histidine kinase n=1 Tax=Demequina sp. TaxID=2050685 RepID=UPI0025D67685|nr:ATP-binding protein [Demequina sp.]